MSWHTYSHWAQALIGGILGGSPDYENRDGTDADERAQGAADALEARAARRNPEAVVQMAEVRAKLEALVAGFRGEYAGPDGRVDVNDPNYRRKILDTTDEVFTERLRKRGYKTIADDPSETGN